MMYPKDTAQPDTRKACKQCGSSFRPFSSTQTVCSPICASRMVKGQRKAEKAAQLRDRKETREKLEKIKPIPDLIKEAQIAFNAFIRQRDTGKPCICCGRTQEMGYGLAAHGWDAGHYRSTGSASHLRFNEDNVHRQLVVCNRHGAGRAVDYRVGLINRIGLERVEALENNNTPHKWTREELREIKATYTAKARELKKLSDER